MKLISPTIHGIIDYFVVVAFALAPTVLGFAGTAATVCYILAAVHFVMTLFTAFPLGVVKLIPFPLHGGLEFGITFALIAMPWLLGFSDVAPARNFFSVSGAAIGLVWLTTDYGSAAAPIARGDGRVRL